MEDRVELPSEYFETRDDLLMKIGSCFEARNIPWVAGRDFSIAFKEFRADVSACVLFKALVVCKCGSAIKACNSELDKKNNVRKRSQFGHYSRHLEDHCQLAKIKGIAAKSESELG
mmetsp:Transcript_22421/g.59569  ORF Transcript_22421/g.59569 Transcript_22421/m.59569 type:complete len:116 (+) Transcript_22421:2-349(+)